MMTDETTNATRTLEPIPVWNPSTPDLVVTPNIHIVFGGLLAFCHNSATRQCDVGPFCLSPDHFLRVLVWEDHRLVHDWTGHAITLAHRSYFLYDQSPLNQGPHFFNATSAAFERDTGHEKDFRWIVDLENSEFYGPPNGRRTLARVADTMKPRFSINGGVFYTERLTTCTFKRQDSAGCSVKYMGRLASFLGAAIKLEPGARNFADISLPGGYSTRMTASKNYDICFLNLCSNPEQNDFHHYLSTIRGESPLLLMWEACPDIEDLTLQDLALPPTPGLLPSPFKPLGSDRAPCASAGFGNGGGLP